MPQRTSLPTLPAWLVALALGFWGISSGAYVLAAPFIVLVLAPRLLPRRFEFDVAEFHRALDVCWVLFFGGLLLVYSREPVGSVFRSFSRWMPAAFFPAVMAQAWSTRGSLPLTALLPLPWWRSNADPRSRLDAAPPYFALTLLSACVATQGGRVFFGALALILALAFWWARPHRSSGRAAFLLGCVAVGGGWYISSGIALVQQDLEARILTWVNRWRGDDARGRSVSTSIGRTGEVGGGSRIVMRVRPPARGAAPDLLRTGTYTAWRGSSWIALQPEREKVEGTGDDWVLDPRPGHGGSVSVEWVPALTDGFLPLPGGTRLFRELNVDRLERTRFGAAWAQTSAGLVSYRAEYALDAAWEGVPMNEDRTEIPGKEAAAIAAVAEEIGLTDLPPAEVARKIDDFFQAKFRYTTDLRETASSDARATTPLGRFLLGSRAGHCEYFATATVLLLRRCGIPARYARGFLVAAAERDGPVTTVREREAHAWVRWWADGRWSDLDPTPTLDFEALGSRSGNWADRLTRTWSDFQFSMARWWWLGEKRLLRQAYWLTVPLLALLLWRFRKVRESTPAPVVPIPTPRRLWPGSDSEWFALEAALEQSGWGRREGETIVHWTTRLGREGWDSAHLDAARTALGLHQRLRFDPNGLLDGDRSRLKTTASDLLGDLPPPPPS